MIGRLGRVALFLCVARVGAAASGAHTAPIRDVAVDPGNRYLVTGSEDKTVRVWDLATGRPLTVIRPPAGKGRDGSIYTVAISPDATTIACGGYTGRKTCADQGNKTYFDIYIYRRTSGTLLHTLSVPYVIDGLVYAGDGAFLISSSQGSFASTSTDFGAERVFSTHDYSWARDALIPNAGAAATIADSGTGNRLLLLQKFGIWRAEYVGPQLHETREIPGIPAAVKISPDGSRIAIAFADSTVGVYSGADLSLLYQPDVTGIGPGEVAFTDQMDLAAASLATVDWSADGTVLSYSGGRACGKGACFIRQWTEGGRGPYADVIVSTARVTRLVSLQNGGVAYATVGPALGVIDRHGARTSFFATKEPVATKRSGRPNPQTTTASTPEPVTASALSDTDLAQLRDCHATVTDLMQQQRYLDAYPTAQRAAAIIERAGDPASAAAAQAVIDAAHVQFAVGQYRRAAGEGALLMREYRDALSLYDRAGVVLGHLPSAERPDVASLLEDRGTLLRAMGRYDEAADALQQALALRTSALGPEDPQTAATLSDLEAVRVMKFVSEKRFIDAFAAAQTAVQDAEKLPPDDPHRALALADLGDAYRAFRVNYLPAAAEYHQRALEIRRRSLGPKHFEVVTSLRVLAEIHVAQKDYAGAQSAYDEARAIEEQVLGGGHVALATFLTRVARVHQSLRDYAAAEPLFRQALQIREKEGQAYLIAHALEDLGGFYRAAGRTAEAEPLYARALSIRETNMGPRHFTVGETARSLGTVLRVKGDYGGAQPLYERAVAIHGSGRDVAAPWAFRDLAALAAAQGNDHAALVHLTDSLKAQEPIFDTLFRPDREESQLEAIQSPHVSGSYWFFLWLAARHARDDPQAVHDAANLVLRRKTLAYDAQSQLVAARKHLSADARRARDDLAVARSELSALLLNKPRGMPADDYRGKLAVLFERSSTLEGTLDRLAPPSEYEALPQNVTTDAVAAALPEKSALVEFVRIPDLDYSRQDFDFPAAQWDAASRYLAFVLDHSGELRLIDLGSAEALDAVAKPVLADVREQNATEWGEHLRALYARLWAPLGLAGRNVDKVMISPDGTLTRVPFAALVDGDGRFLLERVELAYVTSGRELLSGPRATPLTPLLLVANPDFNVSAAGSATDRGVERSRAFVGNFGALPGTDREAAEIPALVPASDERNVLVGKQATEAAVKSANAPRIMHLATHGFFLEDQKLGTPEPEYETPLVRSGLALAGANHAADARGGDDGLLTALEISGMDLSATELVVLSACDTGLGDVRSGEGVFGLRRAFALAGAKNLLMSLWRVDDAITADQMKYFYTNLSQMAPAEALRQAQLRSLRELRAARNGESAPRLWAAFIIQGGHALMPP